jgi:hypothetical protein
VHTKIVTRGDRWFVQATDLRVRGERPRLFWGPFETVTDAAKVANQLEVGQCTSSERGPYLRLEDATLAQETTG